MRHLIALCAAMVLIFPAPAASAAADSNYLVWGVHTKPTIINPILTKHSVSASLIQLIFNSLVRVNGQGQIVPDLAASWDISKDGKTYTFHLRKGVRFHNGQECTSRDFEYTFRLYLSAEVKDFYTDCYNVIEKITCPDPYTLVMQLKEQQPFFLSRLVRYVVPYDCFAGTGIEQSPFNHHPVGTGPFRFKQWTEDNQVLLEANPDYYEGRPYLNGIIVKTYDDAQEVWSALMRGEVDLACFVSLNDYEVLRNDPSFHGYAVRSDCYFALLFNMEDGIFGDRNIRKAVSYAINREELIERLTGGKAEKCAGPFGTEIDSGYQAEYSPLAADELLTAAGWVDADNDGIREKDGRKFEFRILMDSRFDANRAVLMLLRQQLLQSGVRVVVLKYADENSLTPGYLEKIRPHAILRAIMSSLDPGQQEWNWTSKVNPTNGLVWLYNNNEICQLFAAARSSLINCKPIYAKIQSILADDIPACFLFYQRDYHAISARIFNTEGFFNKYMPVYLLKDWHTNAERR